MGSSSTPMPTLDQAIQNVIDDYNTYKPLATTATNSAAAAKAADAQAASDQQAAAAALAQLDTDIQTLNSVANPPVPTSGSTGSSSS